MNNEAKAELKVTCSIRRYKEKHYLNLRESTFHLYKPSKVNGKLAFSRRNDAFADLQVVEKLLLLSLNDVLKYFSLTSNSKQPQSWH